MEARKYFKKMHKNRNSDESGYALVLALGIVILTIGILSSMTMLTVKDVQNSTKNRGVLEARIAGESALDSFYASINASSTAVGGTVSDAAANSDARRDIFTALASFKASNGNLIISSDPDGTATSDGTSLKQAYKWKGWFGIDKNGSIIPCPTNDNTIPCFKLRLIKITTTPVYSDIHANPGALVDEISAGRSEYVVDIVTRTRCNANTTVNCSYSRIQQNITQRKYIEYVSVNISESVKPAVLSASTFFGTGAINNTYSTVNYYSGQDIVQGKIHTNDSKVRTCNKFNSSITSWITAKGLVAGQPTDGVYGGSTLCGAGPTSNTVSKATRAELALPDRAGDTNADGLKAIAKSDGASNYVLSGNPSIVFNAGGTFTVGSVITPMPPSGVLFLVDGGSISGTVKGNITIASAPGKDIKIANNLLTSGFDHPTYTIGVYSGKDIIIACQNANPNLACGSIYITAFLKANTVAADPALRGTIYAENWDRAATSNPSVCDPNSVDSAPIFNFVGAMESYYRGTFGTMDSTCDKVKTGFRKNMYYDTRLLYEQPPFMLRDGTIPFIRSAVKDMPCSTACNNSLT